MRQVASRPVDLSEAPRWSGFGGCPHRRHPGPGGAMLRPSPEKPPEPGLTFLVREKGNEFGSSTRQWCQMPLILNELAAVREAGTALAGY
jgi:hypothetical protein